MTSIMHLEVSELHVRLSLTTAVVHRNLVVSLYNADISTTFCFIQIPDLICYQFGLPLKFRALPAPASLYPQFWDLQG